MAFLNYSALRNEGKAIFNYLFQCVETVSSPNIRPPSRESYCSGIYHEDRFQFLLPEKAALETLKLIHPSITEVKFGTSMQTPILVLIQKTLFRAILPLLPLQCASAVQWRFSRSLDKSVTGWIRTLISGFRVHTKPLHLAIPLVDSVGVRKTFNMVQNTKTHTNDKLMSPKAWF